MITVNFTGGVRKSFETNKITLDKNNLTVNQLIEYLIGIKPKNSASFDGKNLLIAINEIDSSALDGFDTIIKQNDTVNIIPIIHGGTYSRLQMKIFSNNVEIFEMRKDFTFDNNSLNTLRNEFPNLIIQAISSKFLLNKSHIKKILSISLTAKKQKIMISKKLETDILLRFAGTNQIDKAMKDVGIKPKIDFTLIAIGRKALLEKLHAKLKDNVNKSSSRKNNSIFLRKYFYISNRNVISNFTLEDLLAEKASLLM
tara:strand:- start:3864 stop:4631 length:768 start_codon:yes stop_codon:yes gene_type:complete